MVTATRSNGLGLANQPSRYSIEELLAMNKDLPCLSCPLERFKPIAWNARLLVKVIETNPNLAFRNGGRQTP